MIALLFISLVKIVFSTPTMKILNVIDATKALGGCKTQGKPLIRTVATTGKVILIAVILSSLPQFCSRPAAPRPPPQFPSDESDYVGI